MASKPINIRKSTDERRSEDNDRPVLSEGTMAALNEFLAESQATTNGAQNPFAENWGLSQFWYTEETAGHVARECVEAAGPSGRIACIACPSLFRQLRAQFPDAHAHLFEVDLRFETLGNFSLYDYRKPHAVPDELKGAFSVVVADPPYLSEECLQKTVETMKVLARHGDESPKYYLLTGASMKGTAQKLLGLRPTVYRPQHKTKLGNEFLLYTTSEAAANRLGGWDDAA
ncbi:EEF1A lysine methyltransferase 1 [Coccomyxa sp. Obi]|nr:EEF1A lysine methyltransferase 1 [Coccomyxa sp. Obi]